MCPPDPEKTNDEGQQNNSNQQGNGNGQVTRNQQGDPVQQNEGPKKVRRKVTNPEGSPRPPPLRRRQKQDSRRKRGKRSGKGGAKKKEAMLKWEDRTERREYIAEKRAAKAAEGNIQKTRTNNRKRADNRQRKNATKAKLPMFFAPSGSAPAMTERDLELMKPEVNTDTHYGPWLKICVKEVFPSYPGDDGMDVDS